MAATPVVGITCRHLTYRERQLQFIDENFLDAVRLAGGLPLALPITADPAAMDYYVSQIHGLLVSDGDDVDPALYGQPPWKEGVPFDRQRDEFELAMIRRALDADIPVLGVCRGSQVLNVAYGGTLIQDLPTQRSGALKHGDGYRPTYHPVSIAYGHRRWTDEVNSIHHQAVARPGHGLEVIATADDGVIEGTRDPQRDFVVGIQWHPERICAEQREHLFFFAELVRAAAARVRRLPPESKRTEGLS